MSLPLLERAQRGDASYRFTSGAPACGTRAGHPMPVAAPGPGEQYRFHFDMSRCIGCRCCEVACAEQNGNPVEISWRRVGEIEAGSYPFTQRFYLSMGCNHCLEPPCLSGCPVDAYAKNTETGIVLHDPNVCIGCGYCAWTCPYGVPQYNPERGVVGKCDLCHNRLAEGRLPACSEACPEDAIQVELVNIAEWRQDCDGADAPGMPLARQTLSTTRITLPDGILPGFERADHHRVLPEQPHLPLVAMLTLTQLSTGAFLYLALARGAGRGAGIAAALVACLALAASTLHLGRPIHAWRALKMWRRSWLSREVLLFSLFAGAAVCSPVFPRASMAAAALGFAGVTASAFIYLAPARPAWNSKQTLVDFYLTALLLGPLFLAALGVRVPLLAAVLAAGAQLLNQTVKLLRLTASDEFELRASGQLLAGRLHHPLMARLALLIAGGILLPLLGRPTEAFAAALVGELLSRWLFFVSVVPMNVAAGFFARRAA